MTVGTSTLAALVIITINVNLIVSLLFISSMADFFSWYSFLTSVPYDLTFVIEIGFVDRSKLNLLLLK